MTRELLGNFFDFLGFHDEAFTGLPEWVYDTKKNEGTKMIEDYLKKRLFKSEEKPELRQKASTKKKVPASKVTPVKTSDKQIDEVAPAV